jgi:hypothetical protein
MRATELSEHKLCKTPANQRTLPFYHLGDLLSENNARTVSKPPGGLDRAYAPIPAKCPPELRPRSLACRSDPLRRASVSECRALVYDD